MKDGREHVGRAERGVVWLPGHDCPSNESWRANKRTLRVPTSLYETKRTAAARDEEPLQSRAAPGLAGCTQISASPVIQWALGQQTAKIERIPSFSEIQCEYNFALER